MESNLVIAQLILTIILILSSILGAWRYTKNKAKNDQLAEDTARERHVQTLNRINNLEDKVTDMKNILGNGSGGGIKAELKEMQTNCAGKMADINARVVSLEKRNDRSTTHGYHQT